MRCSHSYGQDCMRIIISCTVKSASERLHIGVPLVLCLCPLYIDGCALCVHTDVIDTVLACFFFFSVFATPLDTVLFETKTKSLAKFVRKACCALPLFSFACFVCWCRSSFSTKDRCAKCDTTSGCCVSTFSFVALVPLWSCLGVD